MRKERELIMETRKSANIGARLDRLPNSGWHIKMWLVSICLVGVLVKRNRRIGSEYFA